MNIAISCGRIGTSCSSCARYLGAAPAHALHDYRLLQQLGIAVAREGVPWPQVEQAGGCDFSLIELMIEAMQRHSREPCTALP